MTKTELEQLLRTWQERLLLTRWDLRLLFDIPLTESDSEAEIKVHDYYDQASIRIGPHFESWSSEWATAVIVHELVHVFEKSVRRSAEAVCDAISASAREVYWAWYQFGAEQMVEHVTLAILTCAGEPIPKAPPARVPEQTPPALPGKRAAASPPTPRQSARGSSGATRRRG